MNKFFRFLCLFQYKYMFSTTLTYLFVEEIGRVVCSACHSWPGRIRPVIAHVSQLLAAFCETVSQGFQTFSDVPHNANVIFPETGRHIHPALSSTPLELTLLLTVSAPPPS